MVVAMSRDIRVLVIKLADRLHNMRTLRYLPRGEAGAEVARDAGDLRAAGAPARHEHDQVGARGPRLRDPLPQALRRDRAAGRPSARRAGTMFLQEVIEEVSADLRDAKIKATVTGRPKHYYSVYQKMIVRGCDFDDIYDLVGIRVLVDSVRDCYAALGTVHARWNPVPGRFKDYIAMPKFNMYQSLHTTVIGPEGKPVELQIRTWGMHRRAEYGVAAHWKYKEETAGGRQRHRRHGLAAPAGRLAAGDRRPGRVPRVAAVRPRRRRGLRVHAEGRRDRAAAGRDAGRLRLRGAHRGRPPMHRRPGQRPAGAAGERAGQRRHRRDLHLQGPGRGAEPGLAAVRQERPGPQQDPALVLQGAPRGGHREWQGRDRPGHAQAGPAAAAARHRRRAARRSPTTCATPTSPRCTRRSARGTSARSRSWPSWSGRRAASPGRRRTWPRPRCSPAAPKPLPAGDSGVVVEGAADVWVRLARCCTPVPGDAITASSPAATASRCTAPTASTCSHLLESQPERVVAGALGAAGGLGVPGRHPGRGAGPHRPAVRRHPGAVRPAREHPVGVGDHDQGPGRGQPVHVRDGRPQAPGPRAARGPLRRRRLRRLPAIYDDQVPSLPQHARPASRLAGSSSGW